LQKIEKIEFDEKKEKLIIKSEQYIDISRVENADGIKDSLRKELKQIVKQVKMFKERAEEIKALLDKLEKAGPIDPAP